jgi:muramidase (phage lysozyme)
MQRMNLSVPNAAGPATPAAPSATSPTKSSTTPITTGSGGAAFGMYPKPGGKNPLLDMIAQGESSSAGGYNAMNQGTPGGGPVIGSGDSQKIIQKKLTDMTVGEIMDKGAKPNDDAAKRKENGLIFAAGRYQIIPKTLEGLVKQGVVSKEDKFNEETQDKLGMALINGTGATKLAEGGDYEGAQNALAKTWASIPLATDVGDKKAGQSYYQKAGQNTAHSGLNVKDALMASASTSSPNQSAATLVPNAPSSATTLAAATTAVSQEKMTLASAAPVVNNITNNNVNNSTNGGGSGSSAPSTASVYDDLFAKLVERALA